MSEFYVWLVKPDGDHFADCLLEAAKGIEYSLGRLGHKTSFCTGSHASPDGRPIVFNAHRLPSARSLPSNAIIYNAEQVQIDGTYGAAWRDSAYLDLLRRHVVWDYCQTNIDRLKELGITNTVLCPIGYWPGLSDIQPAEREDLDILFVGSLNERRKKILTECAKRRLTTRVLSGVYGRERNDWIARARIVLNIHFYQNPIFEIFRVSHLLANGKCVVSEGGGKDDALEELAIRSTVYVSSDVDTIPRLCRELIDGIFHIERMKIEGKRQFLQLDQVKFVEQALRDTTRLPETVAYTTKPRVRIYGVKNRGGLEKDFVVLKEQFDTAGWQVEHRDPNDKQPTEVAPVQVFLENEEKELLQFGERNIVIPNPEFWRGGGESCDIWTKTKHADGVFKDRGYRTRYIGWTSVDRQDNSVPWENIYLHFCGQSNRKGTQVLIDNWSPTWPNLTVIASPATWWNGLQECEWAQKSYPPNVRIIKEYVSDDLIKELQNRCKYHIYPSTYEGFGHAMWEGLSCGHQVFIPSGTPPFDDMPNGFSRIDRCKLDDVPKAVIDSGAIKYSPVSDLEISHFFDDNQISAKGLSRNLYDAPALPDAHISSTMNARHSWEQNKLEFTGRCQKAISDLLTNDDSSPLPSPRNGRYDLLVCHSSFEHCGIREYGRQLDESLGVSSEHVNTFNDPDWFIERANKDSIVMVHFEPSLMPRAFIDALVAIKKKGGTVVFVCHWFSPELLHGELGSIVDRFVIHRDYGVNHHKVVRLPLGCPEYEVEEYEIRNPMMVKAITVGFLSGWKETPKVIDAIVSDTRWKQNSLELVIQTPPPFLGDIDGQVDLMKSVLTKHAEYADRIKCSFDFIPEKDLLDLVSTCDFGFAYHGQMTKSASAATKQFVSARRPFVATNSNHNSDVQGGVFRPTGPTLQDFVDAVYAVASDFGLRTRLTRESVSQYEELRMSKTAEKYCEFFRSL